MHQTEHIVELLGKHLNGTLNHQETATLQKWINANPENQQLIDRLAKDDLLISDLRLYWDLWNDAEASEREQRIFNKVAEKTNTQRSSSPFRVLRKWLPYAAALVFMLSSIIYFTHNKPDHQQDITITAKDILPGGNRATLTLADGHTIDLNAGQSGIIVGSDITYLDGSSIADNHANKNDAVETLVLKTPIGGTYQIVLPDGSQVWLNANSTLTYPSRFAANERVVKLEGEAYFQVKHQQSDKKDIPFHVISHGQTVKVLGTEFNVSAYTDEPNTKTTLVNGAVEVANMLSNHRNRISPGQQAVIKGAEMEINKVDVSKSVAWKYGQFSFDGKSFEEIMREMARWYNLTIQYEGSVPTDQFVGNAFKTDKLGTVLRFLESSSIEYRVKPEGNGTYRLIINNIGRKEVTR